MHLLVRKEWVEHEQDIWTSILGGVRKIAASFCLPFLFCSFPFAAVEFLSDRISIYLDTMFSFPFLFLFCPIRLYKDLDAFMDK
jgi:hypothetical protein